MVPLRQELLEARASQDSLQDDLVAIRAELVTIRAELVTTSRGVHGPVQSDLGLKYQLNWEMKFPMKIDRNELKTSANRTDLVQ